MILILFTSNFSYATDDKIAYKNRLLIEENAKLRNELLSLTLEIQGKADKIPVLLYHHISTQEEIDEKGWNNNTSIISLESFKEQMKYLKKNNYYTATLDELELYIDGKLDLPKNTVVITFDDGYLSNVLYAYPIMKEYGYKGCIFMIGKSSLIDSRGLDPNILEHVLVTDMYKYEDVFEFGSHTFDLHRKDEVTGLTLLEVLSKEEIMEDLTRNLDLFGTKHMAYPFGGYNLKTIEYLQELGYTTGFTVKHGYASKGINKYEIPRIIIRPTTKMSMFISLINPVSPKY